VRRGKHAAENGLWVPERAQVEVILMIGRHIVMNEHPKAEFTEVGLEWRYPRLGRSQRSHDQE